MRFDRLLWECLAPGSHEGTDGPLTASLAPRAGETVLLFEIDNPAFRGRDSGVKVCDLLFFHRGMEGRPVLLFVELKGSDYQTAEQQVESAVRRVLGQLDEGCQGRSVQLRAVILLGSSILHEDKQLKKRLLRQYGLLLRYRRDVYQQPVVNVRQYLD